jgi:hypothetical protein
MNFKWTRIKRQVICTLAPCRAVTAACPCRRRRRQSVDCRGISNSAAMVAAVSSDIQTGRMVEWARMRACFCLFVLVCSLQHAIWIGSFAIAMGKWTRNDSLSQQQQRSASSSLHRGGGGACSCTHSPSNKKEKPRVRFTRCCCCRRRRNRHNKHSTPPPHRQQQQQQQQQQLSQL